MRLLQHLLIRLRHVRADAWIGISSFAVYSIVASRGWIWALEHLDAAWHPQGRLYKILMAFSPLAFILYLAITFLVWNFVLGVLLFRVLRLRFPDGNADPALAKPPLAQGNDAPVYATVRAGSYTCLSVTTTCYPPGPTENANCTTVTNVRRNESPACIVEAKE